VAYRGSAPVRRGKAVVVAFHVLVVGGALALRSEILQHSAAIEFGGQGAKASQDVNAIRKLSRVQEELIHVVGHQHDAGQMLSGAQVQVV
jgi:hypothetical protein